MAASTARTGSGRSPRSGPRRRTGCGWRRTRGWAGRPVLDVDTNNTILNDGCGGVWTSPTIIERDNVEIVAVADCHFESPPPYNERVLALNIADGSTKWVFFPPRGDDPDCDFDFGATANLGTRSTGRRPSSASAARTATATRWIRQGWRGRQGSERTPRVLPDRGAHRPAPRRPHHASAEPPPPPASPDRAARAPHVPAPPRGRGDQLASGTGDPPGRRDAEGLRGEPHAARRRDAVDRRQCPAHVRPPTARSARPPGHPPAELAPDRRRPQPARASAAHLIAPPPSPHHRSRSPPR